MKSTKNKRKINEDRDPVATFLIGKLKKREEKTNDSDEISCLHLVATLKHFSAKQTD